MPPNVPALARSRAWRLSSSVPGRQVRLGAALALAWALGAPSVGSADDAALRRRVDRLERELQELKSLLRAQQESAKPAGTTAPRAAVAVVPAPGDAASGGGPAHEKAAAGPAAVAATTAPASSAGSPVVDASASATTVGATAPAATSAAVAAGPAQAAAPSAGTSPGQTPATTAEQMAHLVTDRVKLGGYGSVRFETSSLDQLHDTFTLRRLVLTVDANIAPRLRSNVEVEFERFRVLEVEKPFTVSDGTLTAEQAIEATDGSEIALEQAWLEFEANRAARLRAGAVLVPVGRFNIRHDDNLWNLPRRPLVDRGVPVLAATAAWTELGAGFTGDFEVDDSIFTYQAYVVNGATLDTEIETIVEARAGDTTLNAVEVKVSPSTGTFNLDTKDAKALTGRLAWSPAVGRELAGSFYWGRYTPDFLPDQSLYSLALDGITDLGPFELEGEFVFTHFDGIDSVAQSIARQAINSEVALENEQVESEVEFELANLASDKYGYWTELRYPFFPSALRSTFLGKPFDNPRFVITGRAEQVWFNNLVSEAAFSNGELVSFDAESRILNRFTLGLAYRPTPLVVFQLAYEYTRTNDGKSLSSVTNYLPAGPGENVNNGVLVGAAFGF